tara:strand:- start:302 stop:547 length:246 start_codon:yes stop_codon:yes gene_type:complete
MIRLNIRTYDKVWVKSFVNKNDLINYCNKILSVVPQMEDAGEKLANQIWETNVGQSVKSNIGHVIAVAGKSRAGMVMFGGK